jgi:hypothetical protein
LREGDKKDRISSPWSFRITILLFFEGARFTRNSATNNQQLATNRLIESFRGIQLLRRHFCEAVEFVTIMWSDSLETVRVFAGQDYEVAVVPPKARALLSRFGERSQRYSVEADSLLPG